MQNFDLNMLEKINLGVMVLQLKLRPRFMKNLAVQIKEANWKAFAFECRILNLDIEWTLTFMDSGSLEEANKVAPFSLAKASFLLLDEIAITSFPKALANLIPIVPRPPVIAENC